MEGMDNREMLTPIVVYSFSFINSQVNKKVSLIQTDFVPSSI